MFLCIAIKHTLCDHCTTQADSGMTTISPTKKAVNNTTMATIHLSPSYIGYTIIIETVTILLSHKNQAYMKMFKESL